MLLYLFLGFRARFLFGLKHNHVGNYLSLLKIYSMVPKHPTLKSSCANTPMPNITKLIPSRKSIYCHNYHGKISPLESFRRLKNRRLAKIKILLSWGSNGGSSTGKTPVKTGVTISSNINHPSSILPQQASL